AVVAAPIQPRGPKALAVIQRGVLEGPATGHLHEFDVHLDALPRLSLFKQLHLARGALPRPSQARAAHVAEDALYGAYRDSHIVNTPEPQLRALSAVLELAPRVLDQFDHSGRDAAASPRRIPRHQALEAVLPPAHPPAP